VQSCAIAQSYPKPVVCWPRVESQIGLVWVAFHAGCCSFARLMSVSPSFVLITKLSLLLTGIPIRLRADLSVSSISLSLSLSQASFFSHVGFFMPICLLLILCFFFFFLFCLVNLLRLSAAVPNLGWGDRAICPRVLGSKDDFRFFRDIRFSSNPRADSWRV
jgi:hypothetical protein